MPFNFSEPTHGASVESLGSRLDANVGPDGPLDGRAPASFGASQASADTEYATTLHGLFESSVRSNPRQLAVICGAEHITYEQLNHRATRVARQLVSAGVECGSLVGLFVERSIDMVVGVLAIHKAGAAYVPLDPAYPAERLAFMCEDAELSVLVTQQHLAGRIPRPNAHTIYLDEETGPGLLIDSQPIPRGRPRVGGEQLAYVIYTSGSTGRPKGVMISHRSAVNTVVDVNARFGIRRGDRVLALSSLCFDLSVWDIYGLLASEGTIVIPDPDKLREPAHWATLVERHGISIWNSVPAFMEMLTSYASTGRTSGRLDSIRRVMLSGDWISVSLFDRIRSIAPRAEVISLGGATEAAIWSIYYRIQSIDLSWKSIPYGKPLANQQVWVLDENLEQCPINAIGELFIGGDGVAIGYLNRPELNAEKFIRDVRAPMGRERLYRTGDLGRYLPDGNIEFLGRIDHQVKIQGFRIELGEIEAALVRHPSVAEGVVAVCAGRTGGKSLVAFVVPQANATLDDAALVEDLRRHLPEYMIPARFFYRDRLPLNPSGKVDRSALTAELAGSWDRASDGARPCDEVELRLTRIFERGFAISPIGVDDNFFELGGDSLMAATVLAQIENDFGQSLSFGVFAENPTIQKLAEIVRRDDHVAGESALVVLQTGSGEAPLVCVPGIFGSLWNFRRLASCLGEEATVWGMQQLEPEETEVRQFVGKAADIYVAQLRERQPRGPYYLAGYSFGGPVVYEMAQRLQATGETVALLALLDAPVGGHRQSVCALRSVVNGAMDGWARMVRGAPPPNSGGSTRSADRDHAVEQRRPRTEAEIRRMQMFTLRMRALDAYSPRPYSGRVVLFRASVRPRWPRRLFNAASLKWLRLARQGGEVVMVPGSHDSMFDDGHIEVLAAQLRRRLIASQN